MRIKCADRDQLWAEYIQAVDSFIRMLSISECDSRVADARRVVESYRDKIRQHCVEHGCDPDYLERFGP